MPATETQKQAALDQRVILAQSIDELERTGLLQNLGTLLLRTRQEHLDLLRQYNEFDQAKLQALLQDVLQQEKVVSALDQILDAVLPLMSQTMDLMNAKRLKASLASLLITIKREHALLDGLLAKHKSTREDVRDINSIVQEKRVQYDLIERVVVRLLCGKGGSEADVSTVLSGLLLVLVAFLLHEAFLFKELPEQGRIRHALDSVRPFRQDASLAQRRVVQREITEFTTAITLLTRPIFS